MHGLGTTQTPRHDALGGASPPLTPTANPAAHQADTGTVMRFVERFGTFGSRPGFANPEGVLPGFTDVAPTFDGTSIPAYSDHWVSNVIDREGFLKTLEDTLGFTPKVRLRHVTATRHRHTAAANTRRY